MDPLKIECTSSDRYYDYLTVTGLSVEEMNRILNPQEDGSQQNDRIAEIVNTHNPGLGDSWRWGFGIYSVRHVGGHLLLQIGNNCD